MQLQVYVTFGVQTEGHVKHVDARNHLFKLDRNAVDRGESVLKFRKALEQQCFPAKQTNIVTVTARMDVGGRGGNRCILGLRNRDINTSQLG